MEWGLVRECLRLTIVAYDNAIRGEEILGQDGFDVAEIAVFVRVDEDDFECTGQCGNPVEYIKSDCQPSSRNGRIFTLHSCDAKRG